MDPMTIMSVADVAQYLRVHERAVRRLIERGSIPSLEVAGEPRIQYGALVQWFQSETQARSLETLRQQLQEPSTWRTALEEEPDLRDRLLSQEQDEGTFGAFLKEALFAEPPPDDADEEPHDRADVPRPSSPAVQETLQEDRTDYLRRLRCRPLVALIVTIGAMVIAIAAFTDALRKIWEFFRDCIILYS